LRKEKQSNQDNKWIQICSGKLSEKFPGAFTRNPGQLLPRDCCKFFLSPGRLFLYISENCEQTFNGSFVRHQKSQSFLTLRLLVHAKRLTVVLIGQKLLLAISV
jgi:hypothetical protein